MKKALIIIILVTVLGLFAYHRLGGFNEIEIGIREVNDIHLMGFEYRGTPQDEALPATFRKADSMLQEHPGKTLHTIYYDEPAGKLDTMRVFVGVEHEVGVDGVEEKLIEGQRTLVAILRSNRFVMPGPNKVKLRLEEYAAEHGEETQGIYIDRILGPDHVEVLAPLK
jgi:hypothetical protein